jgi:hypothetical protein
MQRRFWLLQIIEYLLIEVAQHFGVPTITNTNLLVYYFLMINHWGFNRQIAKQMTLGHVQEAPFKIDP